VLPIATDIAKAKEIFVLHVKVSWVGSEKVSLSKQGELHTLAYIVASMFSVKGLAN
jgi:hypothetical protein